MPKVSVIVPNYNHSSFLKERLESIFNQTYQDFEVILLDDASTDNSVSILREYAKDKRVSHFIINKDNSGSPFKQWKKGLELAKGDYIWIAESDDFCSLNFLEKQIIGLNENDVSVSKIIVVNDTILTNKMMQHEVFKKQNRLRLKACNFSYNCPLFNVSSMVFERIDKILLKKALFSKFNIIGDMVFYYEFFLNKQLVYNEGAVNYYRQHDNGLSTTHTKNLKYYKRYLIENCRFINTLFKEHQELSNQGRKDYIRRRYNKIKNRTSFYDKLSVYFLIIYLIFKTNMLVVKKTN